MIALIVLALRTLEQHDAAIALQDGGQLREYAVGLENSEQLLDGRRFLKAINVLFEG